MLQFVNNMCTPTHPADEDVHGDYEYIHEVEGDYDYAAIPNRSKSRFTV
jgi:hypothetical protein